MKVGILALDNCMKSCVTGTYDILSVASMEWEKQNPQSALFDLQILSTTGRTVTAFNGTQIRPDRTINRSDQWDILFIPVIYGDLSQILSDRFLIAWLNFQVENSVCVSAVCAGVFLVAQTGHLNGKKATTHWQLAKEFNERFPKVNLKKEKMLIDEGNIITAGGVTAYMDLALYLTAKFGSVQLASFLSKMLLIDPARQSQMPYTSCAFNMMHKDPEILSVQTWLESNITQRITVQKMAQTVCLGERTFARRFKTATGDTPLEYLQNLRIQKARQLLETSNHSVDTITYQVGYEDTSSFGRLFKRHTGLSPKAYRKRFGQWSKDNN